jgi:hypothetical protein
MTKNLFLLISLLTIAVPAGAALLPTEKDKILFMIFENQNKKILFEKKISCKTNRNDWVCANQTVKQFLMNILRLKSTNAFLLKTEMDCLPVTPELQKNIETMKDVKHGSLEFRREIRQSLKGQWLCHFQVDQSLTAGAEDFDDKEIYIVGADGAAKSKIGLSFIMNRDKNRIVSRKFAGWFSKVEPSQPNNQNM